MSPNIGLSAGEKDRVISAVQEYIKAKVPASLVLGGYNETTHKYPGIEQYLPNTKRKISKI